MRLPSPSLTFDPQLNVPGADPLVWDGVMAAAENDNPVTYRIGPDRRDRRPLR